MTVDDDEFFIRLGGTAVIGVMAKGEATHEALTGPAAGAPPALDPCALINVRVAKKFSGYGWYDGCVVDEPPDERGRMVVLWTSRETGRAEDASTTQMKPAEIVRCATRDADSVAREQSDALAPWLLAFAPPDKKDKKAAKKAAKRKRPPPSSEVNPFERKTRHRAGDAGTPVTLRARHRAHACAREERATDDNDSAAGGCVLECI